MDAAAGFASLPFEIGALKELAGDFAGVFTTALELEAAGADGETGAADGVNTVCEAGADMATVETTGGDDSTEAEAGALRPTDWIDAGADVATMGALLDNGGDGAPTDASTGLGSPRPTV